MGENWSECDCDSNESLLTSEKETGWDVDVTALSAKGIVLRGKNANRKNLKNNCVFVPSLDWFIACDITRSSC